MAANNIEDKNTHKMKKEYFLHEDGKASQPYSLDDLRSKNITESTLVCVKFGEWKPAKDIPELAELLDWRPPPMPSESDWVPPPPQVQTPNMQQSQQEAQPQQLYEPPPQQYHPPSYPQQQTIIIAGLNRKSTGMAFLLSFFFGPLGLFYASVTGGFVMLVLSVIIGIVTFGIGLVFTWIGSIIWAMVAVNAYNETLSKSPAIFNQQQQPQQQQYQQPTFTQSPEQSVKTPISSQPPEQPIQEQPIFQPPSQVANFPQAEPLSQEKATAPKIAEKLNPELDVSDNFIFKYKIPLIIGVTVISVGLAGYNFFLKKETNIAPNGFFEEEGGDRSIENTVGYKLIKSYTGNVGNLSATYSLTWNPDGTIEGVYSYPTRPNVIYKLKGEILGNGRIILTEFSGNEVSARCNLLLQNDCYVGEMKNTDGRVLKMSMCLDEATSTGYVQTKQGSDLRLRSQPSDQAPVIANIPNRTTVIILGYSDHFEEINGEKGKWCNINFNGKIGWAWGGFIINNTNLNQLKDKNSSAYSKNTFQR